VSDHLRAQDAAMERLRLLHPKKIDLSLGRVERLCAALGHPERQLPPLVHVAGTNGKGSTVAFLRAIAEAAGLRVHVFTSPHLVRFAERIRLAGALISDEALTAVLDQVEAANAGQPITFFEITTVAALTAFASVPADLCIIEVGLGGRFDSTNVIPTPKLAVIAPVDLDHKEFLGEDLAGIATEKAGILKTGGTAVVARQRDAARKAIEVVAEQARSDLRWMGQAFDAFAQGGRMVWQDDQRLLDLPLPALTGAHQIDNAGLAIAAALALDDPRITEDAIGEGLQRVSWPARLQRLTGGPLAALTAARGSDLWLDGGHNPHAAAALAEAARAMTARDGRPLTLIVGLLANKDAAGVLAPFKGLGGRLIFTGFEAEAAASPDRLAEVAQSLHMPCEMASDVSAAVAAAVAADGPSPHILIFGSLYLAGEVLALSPDTWPN
jgi:dihydrofolate synthase/folylpolyglutamate synthase